MIIFLGKVENNNTKRHERWLKTVNRPKSRGHLLILPRRDAQYHFFIHINTNENSIPVC